MIALKFAYLKNHSNVDPFHFIYHIATKYQGEIIDLNKELVGKFQLRFRSDSNNILSRNILGQCILSKDDKNVEPESFRVATITDEYIENNCNTDDTNESFMDDLCSYEHFPNSTLMYVENFYEGLNDKEVIFAIKSIIYKYMTYFIDAFIHISVSSKMFH